MRSAFRRKVLLQRAALSVESLAPRTIPALYTLMATGAATFLGAWQHIPENYRPYLFIPIALMAIAPIPFMGGAKTRKTNPFAISRDEALRRLDENSGDKKRPATMIASAMPEGSTDVQRANLQAYQDQTLREKLGTLKVRKPILDISRYTAVAGAALAVAFGISVMAAGDERGERLAAAFDFTPPEHVVPPPKLWAAIKPPEGITQIATLYLADEKDPEAVFRIHPQSTLEILSFDRLADIKINGQPLELDKVITSDTGQKTYKFKPVTLDKSFCGDGCVIQVENGQTWPLAMNADNPPVVAINGVDVATDGEQKSLQLRCKATDDYGIKDGQLMLEASDKHEAAEPPPQAQLPILDIPREKLCP